MFKDLNFYLVPSNECVFKDYETQTWKGSLDKKVINSVCIGKFDDESLDDRYYPLCYFAQHEGENDIQFCRVVFHSEDRNPHFNADVIINQNNRAKIHIDLGTFDFYDSHISYAAYESTMHNKTFLVELTFSKDGKTLTKYLVVK